eukprot:gene403-114_t
MKGRVARCQSSFFSVWKQRIDASLNSNNVDAAVKVIDEMVGQKLAVPPQILSDVLKAVSKSGDAQNAVRILTSCYENHTRPNASCYSAVIHSHRRKRPPDADGALKYLGVMERKQFSPNSATYGQVIACYNETSQPDLAARILERMCAKNVRPDTFQVANVIQGFCKKSEMKSAVRWFCRMRKIANPDTCTYNILIAGFAQSGNAKMAVLFMEKLLRSGNVVDMFSFSSIINAYSKVGDSISAEFWLRKSKQYGKFDQAMYHTMTNVYSRASSSNYDARANRLANALKPLAKSGDVVACKKMFDTSPHRNAACYTALISAHRRKKPPDAAGAMHYLNEMIREGLLPNCATFSSVISAFGENGDTKAVGSLFERMKEISVSPDLFNYSSVIQVHSRAGDSDSASKIFDECLSQNLVPDLVCFNAVADSFAKKADPANAKFWLEKAEKSKLKPDVVSHNIILSAFANKRHPEGAVKFLMSMLKNNAEVNTRSFNAVINAYAMKPDAYSAYRWLLRMQHFNIAPTSISFSSLITAGSKTGNSSLCVRFMNKALQSKVTLEVSCFNALLGVFCTLSEVDNFMYWFGKMDNIDDVTLNLYLDLHSKIGQIDTAARFLEDMIAQKKVRPGVHLFSVLVDGYAKSGNSEKAAFYLKRMKDFGVEANSVSYKAAVQGHQYADHIPEDQTEIFM